LIFSTLVFASTLNGYIFLAHRWCHCDGGVRNEDHAAVPWKDAHLYRVSAYIPIPFSADDIRSTPYYNGSMHIPRDEAECADQSKDEQALYT
jgi:hypothetical protein